MRNVSFEDLSQIQKDALQSASRVLEYAYNPYSHFYVGAALITQGNHLVLGANVENAAFGSTICAERAAVLHANALGFRKFEAIAIIARSATFDAEEPTAPCGSCRQVLYEVSQISEFNMEIILSNTRMDKIIVTSIRELLPLAFGPIDLGIDVTRYQQ